jgi:hypothetical protein
METKLDEINNNNDYDKNETKITICIYDKYSNEVLEYFEDQLNKIKKITNSIKRKILNEKILKFINVMKNKLENHKINSLFFIDHDIIEIKLEEKELQIARQYQLKNPFYKTDSLFLIEYFKDFFCNGDYMIYIKINKLKMEIKKFTKYKQFVMTKNFKDEVDIENELENYKNNNQVYIYGLVKTKLNDKFHLLECDMDIETFLNYIEKKKIKMNHEYLEKRLSDLKNEKTNLDLYVFGKLKTIKEAIESYQLKELYIEKQKHEKLKLFIDKEFFNFKIYIIESIDKNDIGETFISNYNGIMGIKYF